jgi:outer membrane protein assembly factor BamB
MPALGNLSRLVCLGIILILSVGYVQADNWERFRGPNGDGISNDKNIPIKFSDKENVRWKTPIAGVGYSSPIIWGDRLFVQTSTTDGTKRTLLCLDANTGKEVWTRSIPGTKAKIHTLSSLASATPTTDGEAVYIPFWNGKDVILTAYNFKGDKLWDRNLGEFISQHGAGISPIVFGDLLIYANDKDAFRDVNKKTGPVADPSRLLAINKKTGDIVWERPRDAVRACYTVPFVLEKPGAAPELIVTSTSAITSYDPKTGNPNWNWNWPFPKDPLRTIATTLHTKGLLFACSGDGSGERFMVAVAMNGQGKEARPDKIWENRKEFPYVTCPLVHGDYLYFINDLGRAGCFHAKTGKKVWFETIPDTKFNSSPVVIDGKIYMGSEEGHVYVIAADPTGYHLLAKNDMGERIRATPAVANGSLYIRTQSNLYCIGKK